MSGAVSPPGAGTAPLRLTLPIPPPEPKFALLAAELLSKIFANLDSPGNDISNIRLVCKTFANACVQYMPNTWVVSYTKDSLEKLEHLSNHPLFSQHIQSLALDCSLFWTLVPGKPNQPWDYVAEPDPRPFPWCQTFKTLWEEQRDIRRSNKDFAIISKAIPQLRRLKHIRIYMDCFRRAGRVTRETYNSAVELFSFAHDKPVSCSVHQYLMVMKPLLDAGIRIETLELRDVSYAIFCPQDDIVAGMEKNFQHLTSLYIRVQTHPEKIMITELSEILSLGVMARFLEAAGGLRSLTLASKDDHGNRMMNADYAFSSTVTWKHLHTLSLDNLWISEDVLTGLATRHSKTLRRLTLHNMVIRGSWFTALPAIREVTSLDKAIVYGWLSNPAGEYARREYWRLGVYPDRVKDTPWGDDERQYQLGLQVGLYLCKVPTASYLPLAYSNMTR